ncbi:MAG TPA: hypothetical protein VNW71_14360 [Thermoanaerobaculia bacterium]|nr:hypothetical protein [Thermoanaerobaculia bacterium]
MRRSLIALALAVPLISQPALFESFWDLLSAVWAESSPDAGCGADPSGICAPNLDEGCGADPDGRCATAPQPEADAGCGADPDGRPRCSS